MIELVKGPDDHSIGIKIEKMVRFCSKDEGHHNPSISNPGKTLHFDMKISKGLHMKGIELDDAAIAVSQLLHLLGIFLAVPISKDVKHHRTMGIIFKDTDKACAHDLKIAVIDVIGNVQGRFVRLFRVF